MPFPSNPIDGQQAVLNGILYEYDSINDTWTRVVTNINFVTASFVGTNNSTNTQSGTIIVSGGAGIAGNLYANSIYSDGWFYAANGLPISFSAGGGGSSLDQFARDTANSASNLAQSAYNYANTIPLGGGGGPYIITGAQYVDYGWLHQPPSVVQFDFGTI